MPDASRLAEPRGRPDLVMPAIGDRRPAGSAPRPDSVLVTTAADAAEWDAYVEQHPDGTVEHLWGWHGIFSGVFGHEASYLIARRNGRATGVLPVVLIRSQLFGRSAVSLPFFNYAGIVADHLRDAEALLEAAEGICRRFGARSLELRHRHQQFPHLANRQNKVGVALPLPPGADELWKKLDRKIRNQVRKAQKDGLRTEIGGSSLLTDFYDVFSRNMRDLGTPVFAAALFSEAVRRFPDRSQVFVVQSGTRATAAAIGLRFRDTVFVPWASSLKEYRASCANMLLYWSMLQWSIERGARIFDFGRSSTGSGALSFKRQWGPVESALHTEYLLLKGEGLPGAGVDGPGMRFVVAGWKRLPLPVANALGPHVIRHVS